MDATTSILATDAMRLLLAVVAPYVPVAVLAPDAGQDVFMREVRNLQRHLDEPHDTRSRSMVLIKRPVSASIDPVSGSMERATACCPHP